MELSYMELREQICDVCHKMWQLGWVPAKYVGGGGGAGGQPMTATCPPGWVTEPFLPLPPE